MDLTFKTPYGRFNYRVGAIILHDGKVLLMRNPEVPYLYSVGGRVNYNETTEEAVIREVLEETGVKLSVDRPVCPGFHCKGTEEYTRALYTDCGKRLMK